MALPPWRSPTPFTPGGVGAGEGTAARPMPITHLRDLTPDPANARAHTPRNVGLIQDALQEVGAARSIVIDEHGTILAGNATVEAAAAAGIERVQVVDADGETIIAVRRTGLSPKQKSRLALFDNRSGEEARWNLEVLQAMQDDAPDLLAGLFRADELAALLAGVGVAVEPGAGGDDFTTEPDPAQTRVQPGDVWQIGPHIVACLDATDPDAVQRIAGALTPTFVWADPPYGIDLLDKPGNVGLSKVYRPVAGDATNQTAIDLSTLHRALWPNAVQVWWGANHYADALPASPCWIVWYKDHPGMSFADAELAWVNQDRHVRVFTHAWSGAHRASERGVPRMHVNQKPVALCDWVFTQYGKRADVIVDPCVGSGPSVVAAHRMGDGRRVVGFDLDPACIDMCLRRAEAEQIGPIHRA
jgi:hypothetical protein